MASHRSFGMLLGSTLLVLALLLPGCGATAVPTAAPTQPPAPTKVPSTPTPTGPTVGGTYVVGTGEIETLDSRTTGADWAQTINYLLGSTLVVKDLQGKYQPWVALSWTTSPDGLVWEFKLRKDVKFHNGTPMTAKDFVYTIASLLDTKNAFPQRGRVSSVKLPEAPDDYTLRLNMASPYPVLLEQLSNTGIVQPLLQSYVEQAGTQYGRQPIGIGPFKFKEWKTGEKIVLERNADYVWAPPFLRQGPYYIQTFEARMISEYSTILSGLESGDIDQSQVEPKDIAKFQNNPKYQIITSQGFGMDPVLNLNCSQPPLDDVRVRRALYLGVDRAQVVTSAVQGHASPSYGPLTSDITGYWPGVEKLGGYDPAQAKKLLADAGYTAGSGGILQKGGKPLHLVVKVEPGLSRLAEVVKEQYKPLGIDLEIQIVDQSILWEEILDAKYEVMILAIGYSESDILYRWYSGSRQGALNPPRHSDAELNRILDLTRSSVDPDKRQEYLNQAQQRIVEQALIVPLYAPKMYTVISARTKGVIPRPLDFLYNRTFLNDAYFETK